MSRDPLDAVLKIRQSAVDEARRGLAASLRTETTAQALAEAADARINAEGEIAADLNAGDGAVEAYVRWLPTGRAQAAAARRAHDRAQADVAITRAALSVARAAAEAAASLLARRAAERAALADRRAQQDMDEIASRQRTGA